MMSQECTPTYQEYAIFEAVKEFVSDLSEAYQEESDQPLHFFNVYLSRMNISMPEATKVVEHTIDFCGRNLDIITQFVSNDKSDDSDVVCDLAKMNLKDNENFHFDKNDSGIVFDEDAFVDVAFYCSKEDDNQSTIFDHLKRICYLIEGGVTEEEKFLNRFVASFATTLDTTEIGQLSEESADSIGNAIKPTIDASLQEFQNKQLNVNGFLKSISFKIREYLETNEVAGIKKEELKKILDLAIENNVDELFEKKYEIFGILSSSGILTHLPFDKIMSIASSYTPTA